MLFGLALVTLLALASWWTVFLVQSVELERQTARARLFHLAEIRALRGDCAEASSGPLADEPALEVVPAPSARAGAPAFVIGDSDCPWVVQPTEVSLAAIEARLHRRQLMVGGEGGLLFLLLALFVGLLHRWAHQELGHLRRMESFVASFSHELKTPLSGVKSLLQTLAAQRIPPERQQGLLLLGIRQAEQLQRSIENVLLSGSLRAGRYQVRLEPVGLAGLLDTLVAAQESTGEQDAKRLTVDWDAAASATVLADAHALRIVLENIVDNALKYGDGSAVRLRVRSGQGRHFIDVADQGPGFVPAESERLFLPFERGARRGEPNPQGSGLGLYISRSLVKRMGGELSARSAGLGQGACFTIALREAP